WDEASINWNTAPGIVTTETAFDSVTTEKLGVITTSGAARYELDISEYFAKIKSNGAITIGIAEESGNTAYLASKEDADSQGRDRKPYLYLALDVSALTAKIAEANALADSIKVGTGEGECTQQAKDEFNSAIAAAQSVTNKWDATESEISDAITALDAAMTTFGSSVNNNAINSYNETLAKAKQLQSKVTTDKYTQDAIDAYAAAITAAEALAANGGYNQATADLETAMDTLLAGHVASPGVELSSTDDAYIQKGKPDTNYAGSESSTNLVAGNSGDIYLAYLKFDISAYPGEYGRAKLRFFSKDTSGYTLGIYGLSDTSWSESTLTWNTAPNRGDSGFGSGTVKIGEITTSGRQNYEFDLGTYFKAHNADEYISIGIAMESNTNAFLSQGENADPGCRPVLTLGLDASALEEAIDEAQTLYDNTRVGLGTGSCTQQSKDALSAAISAAKKVYSDYTKTTSEYNSAADTLISAVDTFKAEMYCIGIEITEMTVNGAAADALSAGEVKVKVKVTNIGTNMENIDVYFALLKDTDETSSLEDIDVKHVTVAANGNVICEGTLDVTDAEGLCLKVFCWDENIQPKTEPLTK
ncbi:MAG: DNRLRE domain-containing protein, partial [Clostridia bacterium]|nr:DNRLRE domain-containing protein [Clostridia bacterium]